MRLLLDTSAYVALVGGHPAIADEASHAERLFLSPVVLGELLAGFRKGTRYEGNAAVLEAFLGKPGVAVLSIDEETADRYAILHEWLRRAGRPIPSNDLWIAASAFQHGLRVLTTDRHFTGIPQIVTICHPP
jgi:tRNA(fMet)-specific endonuclease VapC